MYIKNRIKKVSEYQKENNSMKNKCWCVPKNLTDKTQFNANKRVFDVNNIPEGWYKGRKMEYYKK